MIVSHKYRFIFAAIPKTGTHAVRRALRDHMGPDDLEQVGLFVQKQLPYRALAELRHGHISLEQVRPYIGEQTFQAYCKFAFVRNPYDRFVSYCAFMTRESGAFGRDPRAVMAKFALEAPPVTHLLFYPQHTFTHDHGGRKLVDIVGRVERMQDSYDEIARKLGIPTSPLDHVNASRHEDYRTYYDNELVDAVTALYKADLEKFGYDFETGAG
jgi:hypothetical protein